MPFSSGNAGPAYYPTEKGCEALSIWFDDERWMAVNTKSPRNDRLFHWIDISEMHRIVHDAAALHDEIELCGWFNEWETINKDDAEAHRYFLHTQFREEPRPLSCSPDAAFMIKVLGIRRVYYVEVDRATTGPRRVAASKTPGYAELARTQAHRRHFPQTNCDEFSVLLITTDAKQRNRLAQEVGKCADARPELWLFIDRNEFAPQNVFFGPIAQDCFGQTGALLETDETPLTGGPPTNEASARH